MCQATDIISFDLHNTFLGYSYFPQIEEFPQIPIFIQQIRHKVRIWLHVLYFQRQALFTQTGYFQFRNKVRLSPLYAGLLANLLAQNISKK